MKKVIFVINVDNVIDIITNSSSELFVLEAESADIVKQMVSEVYQNYTQEYEEPRRLIDCTIDEIETYIGYNYLYHDYNIKDIDKLPTPKGINPEDLYKYRYFGDGDKYITLNNEWLENNKEKLFRAIDPEGKMFLMFSLDENPDWEMQKRLMNIGSRYHLG